jgi:VWFA-related protein
VLVTVIGLAGAFALPTQSLDHPQQPVFRATTDLVAVDVSVTRGRSPVAGLGRSDFTLLDNGVPQEIDAVALETLPIDVTLVVDVSPTASDRLLQVRPALEGIRGLLRSGDRLRVLTFGLAVRQVVRMKPANEVLPLDGPDSVVRVENGDGSGYVAPTVKGASLDDAMFYALAWPSGPERRHLVVVFTEGIDTWSTLEAERVPELADHADAVVHFVMTAARPGPSIPHGGPGYVGMRGGVEVYTFGRRTPELAAAEMASWDALDKVVERTGGELHHLSGSPGVFADALNDFRSSYVLRYTLSNVTRAGWHEITVKVTRSGSFTIRARKGYSG